jgi:hypothetical protein
VHVVGVDGYCRAKQRVVLVIADSDRNAACLALPKAVGNRIDKSHQGFSAGFGAAGTFLSDSVGYEAIFIGEVKIKARHFNSGIGWYNNIGDLKINNTESSTVHCLDVLVPKQSFAGGLWIGGELGAVRTPSLGCVQGRMRCMFTPMLRRRILLSAVQVPQGCPCRLRHENQ